MFRCKDTTIFAENKLFQKSPTLMCRGSENSLFEMTRRFAVKHKDPHKALFPHSPRTNL